jgi:protein SERAC1
MEPLSEQRALQQKNRILRLFSARDNEQQPPSSSSSGTNSGSSSLSPPSADVRDVYWPLDLLPGEVPSARILAWGYETLTTRDISTDERAGLSLHGRDLLFCLHKERPTERPLMFVAHSLGGLIVKETLRRSQVSGETELQDVSKSTKSVIFLGTPHRLGSGFANLGEQIYSIASTILQTNTTYAPLRAWGFDKPELELGRQSFLIQWHQQKFAVKTFQESRLTMAHGAFMSYKTVPDDTSSLGDSRERCEQLQADHKGLVQYRGGHDGNFKKVVAEIKKVISSVKGKSQISWSVG